MFNNFIRNIQSSLNFGILQRMQTEFKEIPLKANRQDHEDLKENFIFEVFVVLALHFLW
jgi:hypothetical protein